MCPSCNGTGYRTIEVPVFRDGGYSDVDQIERPCACNPDPSDDDAPDNEDGSPYGSAWEDFQPSRIAELYREPLDPDPSDYWLPAHLLA